MSTVGEGKSCLLTYYYCLLVLECRKFYQGGKRVLLYGMDRPSNCRTDGILVFICDGRGVV